MVFDTNVLAYALLGVPEQRSEALESLLATPVIWAPDSLRAEMVNVVWQWIRFGQVELAAGSQVLEDTELLVTHFVPASELWQIALELAVAARHSPYDTLFVALAAVHEVKVVTYDRGLLKRFPEWTITAADYLADPSQGR